MDWASPVSASFKNFSNAAIEALAKEIKDEQLELKLLKDAPVIDTIALEKLNKKPLLTTTTTKELTIKFDIPPFVPPLLTHGPTQVPFKKRGYKK